MKKSTNFIRHWYFEKATKFVKTRWGIFSIFYGLLKISELQSPKQKDVFWSYQNVDKNSTILFSNSVILRFWTKWTFWKLSTCIGRKLLWIWILIPLPIFCNHYFNRKRKFYIDKALRAKIKTEFKICTDWRMKKKNTWTL